MRVIWIFGTGWYLDGTVSTSLYHSWSYGNWGRLSNVLAPVGCCRDSVQQLVLQKEGSPLLCACALVLLQGSSRVSPAKRGVASLMCLCPCVVAGTQFNSWCYENPPVGAFVVRGPLITNQTGPNSVFEMRFAIGSQHCWCRRSNSPNQNTKNPSPAFTIDPYHL